MKKSFLFFCILFTFNFFPTLSQNIKSPSEFLGYELGTRFTQHHKVVEYFKYVRNTSNLVSLEKYGETNENRPLYVSYISSKENIKNLDKIREDNLSRIGILKGNTSTQTGIVWLSYNVHGNEASSTEAAMLTIYKLITKKQEWLNNTVVIIDPCLNPDGRERYVNWYNQVKSTPFNTNAGVIEHNEPWPGGRPNHYLFDLNRDWAWATQIETQQRLKVYNKWMPQIHVDFHEQYINNPYYFAPGAEPYHEIITDWQRNFQIEIGKNHAKYFDKNGWRYFTKESFDLLYPSYGDTYPTFMGAIGMTYEQAGHGKAGLGINIENGTVLTLKDRIAHHTTTGLSTVEIASNNTTKMIEEFEQFFDNSNEKVKSYILKGDSEKVNQVIKLLNKHEIESYFTDEKTVKVFDYESNKTKAIKVSGKDLIIPTNQPKGKMVKVLFEKNTKLSNPVTYDITAWSIPYIYGLQGFSSEISIPEIQNKPDDLDKLNEINKSAYAYINKWKEVSDAAFLGSLLKAKFNVRFSKTNFSVEGNNFDKGSLIIMRGENTHISTFDETVVKLANDQNKSLYTSETGFVDSGSDFGSNKVTLIKQKNIAVLYGSEVSSGSFGQIWHFFETQLQYPLNIIDSKNLKHITVSKYQTLILPEGYYASEENLKSITSYANSGGVVISLGNSINSFADKDDFLLKKKKTETKKDSSKTSNLTPYNQREAEYIKNEITGSIFKSTIDDTHPLAFGYKNYYYSLKLSSSSYELLDKGFNVGYFPNDSQNISGYSGEKALGNVSNSLLFGIERKGRGQIIYMVDNPLFRSFWENGKLFFANALFLN